MKTTIKAMKTPVFLTAFLLLTLLVKTENASAQLPDCVSGTVGYVTFYDSISSAFTGPIDSTEIRPVNLLTGTVGGLIGNRRYWIRKYRGSGGTGNDANYIYGTSALAVDFITSRFYVMTQMSSSLPKDIITINPITGVMTTIGTTPVSLDDYHFVKMAGNNNGWIYAIGVVRDTTLVAANRVNPLIRFQTCGLVPSAGCATSTIQVLGYLQNIPGLTSQWLLFNGDIAFDNSGNLFFATAGFERIGGSGRYTDSRLFRINAADLPTSAGTGSIPMSLVSDYNSLDSTVINGVGFAGNGNMYMTTRRYLGPQNPPLPNFVSEMYRSDFAGNSILMPAFVRPTPGTSATDIATCFFPSAVLAKHGIVLTGQQVTGASSLRWEVSANKDVSYFEVQRSDDGINFETISNVGVINPDIDNQKYSFTDIADNNTKAKFYRVRSVLKSGVRYYSNVIKLNSAKVTFSSRVKPNPFVNEVELTLNLRTASPIQVRVIDHAGRIFLQRKFIGKAGENRMVLNEVASLKAGVYYLEAAVDNESVREKIVKQ
jgi:hypothetical protein